MIFQRLVFSFNSELDLPTAQSVRGVIPRSTMSQMIFIAASFQIIGVSDVEAPQEPTMEGFSLSDV